jgi:hypothetical protein
MHQRLWPVTLSYKAPAKPGIVEILHALFERLTEPLAVAVAFG